MSRVKNIVKQYKIKPSKRLGQNFLIDKSALFRLISTAKAQSQDIILEIGPGSGVLTKELAKAAKMVIAVEKDPRMIKVLKESLKDFSNVEVIYGDILKLKPAAYASKPYKVVANLPFYLTAPVIRKFLESQKKPELMALIVQKEVAQRLSAKPAKMSILAVSVQFYAEAKIVAYVSKKSFWPQPKVDSAIVKIVPRSSIAPCPQELFFKIVRAGFSHPRKQLANNLSRKLKLDKRDVKMWLLQNKISPNQRAETLSVENWIALTKSCIIK